MIVQVEQAAIARLKAAGEAEVLGYRFARVDAYPADWAGALTAAPTAYPAAWISFVKFRSVDQQRSGALVEATYELILAAQNLRNLAAAREGVASLSEVGSIQLMLDVIGLLQGEDFGLEISNLEVTAGEMADLPEEVKKAKVSATVVQFTTQFTLTKGTPYFSPTGEFIGDLETFHVDWQPPAGDLSNLTTQLQLPIQE